MGAIWPAPTGVHTHVASPSHTCTRGYSNLEEFIVDGIREKGLLFIKETGETTSPPKVAWISHFHIKYQYYWDRKRLFVRSQNGTFNCHEPRSILDRLFRKPSQPAPLPSEATPVRVVTYGMFLYVSAHTFHLRPQTLHSHTPKSFVSSCPARERRILGVLPDFDTVSQTLSLLESGALVAATDGSFNPHRRKAAGSWTLSTKNGKRQVQGVYRIMAI